MIGGQDIEIPTAQGSCALDFAARAVRERWPDAVFEDAQTGELFADYSDLQLVRTTEIFAYKDKLAKSKWDELGADESLVGTMIHILQSGSRITLVVDSEPSGEVLSLVNAIQDGLRSGVFSRLHWRTAA